MNAESALKRAVEQSGMTLREVSRNAGMQDDSLANNLNQSRRRGGNLSCDMVAKYARAAGWTLCLCKGRERIEIE
jgi:lambda repressor-like predicted transcriptional regulator